MWNKLCVCVCVCATSAKRPTKWKKEEDNYGANDIHRPIMDGIVDEERVRRKKRGVIYQWTIYIYFSTYLNVVLFLFFFVVKHSFCFHLFSLTTENYDSFISVLFVSDLFESRWHFIQNKHVIFINGLNTMSDVAIFFSSNFWTKNCLFLLNLLYSSLWTILLEFLVLGCMLGCLYNLFLILFSGYGISIVMWYARKM